MRPPWIWGRSSLYLPLMLPRVRNGHFEMHAPRTALPLPSAFPDSASTGSYDGALLSSCPAVQPVAPSFSVLKAHFLTRANPRTPVKTLCGLTNDIGATGSCGAGPQGRAAASFRIRPKVQAVPPSSPGRPIRL
jgi:hypothetical protein